MTYKELISLKVRLYKHFIIANICFDYWMEGDSLRIYLQSSDSIKWQKVFMCAKSFLFEISGFIKMSITKKYSRCTVDVIWVQFGLEFLGMNRIANN